MPETATPIAQPSPSGRASTSKGPARLRTRIGCYSANGALSLIDGRSKEAVFLRRRVKELSAHVAPGGQPSASEAAMIERCAWLSLRLAILDARVAAGELDDHSAKAYIAWSNALTRTLARLGLKAAKADPGAVFAAHMEKLSRLPQSEDDAA